MFASLLVGLDGSPGADAALDAAIALGRRFRPHLVLAAVVEVRVAAALQAHRALTDVAVGVPGAMLGLGEAMTARANGLLKAGAARVRAAGLDVVTSRQTGVVEEELLKLAETAEALVVGRRGELALPGDLGDHTVRLIRRSPHAVVVATERPSAFARPVVAYDRSETSTAALALAARYATAVGVPLDVVTVNADVADADALLAQAVAFLSRSDAAYETHRLEGEVSRAVAGFAERTGCDFIVCGAHGRRRSWTMGSTAEALARTAAVPTIVVR